MQHKQVYHYAEWQRLFLDYGTGYGVTDNGATVHLAPRPRLADILAAAEHAGARLVYLTGEIPGGGGRSELEAWALAPDVLATWDTTGTHLGDAMGHGSGGVAERNPVLRMKHRESKRSIQVRRCVEWYGEDGATPDAARVAMRALRALLRTAFGNDARVLTTPAQTGLALLAQLRALSLYPVLPDTLRNLVHETSGQGRIEICTLPERAEIPEFVYMDGRFMYAACAERLGCGEAIHDDVAEFEPHARGRYRVRYTVPEGWQHIGLLMTKHPDGGWHYPSTPGETAETWAGAAEVALALARGWQVDVCERLLFPGPMKGLPGPLDTFVPRLTALYAGTARLAETHTAELAERVRFAARAIVLHTIGALARRAREQTYVVSSAEAHSLPGNNPTIRRTANGNFTYRVLAPLTDAERIYQHPEWAAEIWARARKRMLFHETRQAGRVVATSGALTLPRADVLAIRTDALYLACAPQWHDGGVPGDMRCKGIVPGPLAPPRTQGGLNMLRNRAAMVAEGGR